MPAFVPNATTVTQSKQGLGQPQQYSTDFIDTLLNSSVGQWLTGMGNVMSAVNNGDNRHIRDEDHWASLAHLKMCSCIPNTLRCFGPFLS